MSKYVSPSGVEIVMGDEAARAVGYKSADEVKAPVKRRGRAKSEQSETVSDDD